MANESSLVFSGIAPHPPIMVPEVGRESLAQVRRSIDGMAELTERIIASGATTIILISPHAPLDVSAFVAYPGPDVVGDFSGFRAPSAHFEAAVDKELLDAIRNSAIEEDYEVMLLPGNKLDHGTAVPLYFLLRNGWIGNVVALGYTFLDSEDHVSFGACIRKAVDSLGRRAAFVASGDLSHRLKPEAPAGYNPIAHVFDDEVVAALRSNTPEKIIEIDPDLRRLAGECGYRSMLVALGASRDLPQVCDVLSYEAPFGVGYLVAQITNSQAADIAPPSDHDARSDPPVSPNEDLTGLARRTVETFVQTGKRIETPQITSGLLGARAGCFVSLKTRQGELRGCIGTIEPAENTLAEELVENAINACTRDPRFPPVAASELSGLIYSVDVLNTPEPALFEELDPLVYGVIVEDDEAVRRGLLLPDIDGVDSAKQQVEIAARKAGIAPDAPVRLFRFSVQRFRENVSASGEAA
ncbi:MAG TPA: AmmeMemoRadiSam system protein A [Pyrinomonadaceae bacterium]|nr:AmmeMemoRadiSam system protein A [Pyrinomonadaceae bacterium]